MHKSFPSLLLALVGHVASVQAQAPTAPQTVSPFIEPALEPVVLRLRHGTALRFDITPDGRTIVFDLLGQLWSLPVEGGEAVALTNAVRDSSYDTDPALSPDGKWIAFRSDRPRGSGLWLYSPALGTFRQLTDSALFANQEHRAPAWSPDGSRLAYTRAGRLWIHEVSTGASRPLTPEGLAQGSASQPVWSHDGRRIVAAARTLMEIDLAANRAIRVDSTLTFPRAPRYSPDEKSLAYFHVRDSSGVVELWVRNRGDSAGRLLDARVDLSPLLVRWSPDGQFLYYSAAGGLWRVSPAGGRPTEIPFEATLTFARPRYATPTVSLPGPGQPLRARGFGGLSIAPDGVRYAMIALGKLWIAGAGQQPRSIVDLPVTARGLSWSPDGSQVAWAAGRGGAEDLFVTEVQRGATRQLTALPGRESHAAWSPDGRFIAFLHWMKPALADPPWAADTIGTRIRVIPVELRTAARLADTRDLGTFSPASFGVDRLSWNPASSAILTFATGDWPIADRDSARAVWIGVDGSKTALARFPYRPSFVHVDRAGALTYVQDGLLWRSADHGEPRLLSASPALFPTVAEDGTVLFVSGDGLRLRHPRGTEVRLGWPIEFRVPRAPPPLVVRNARVFDGSGSAPTDGRDILIANGRISRIAAAGRITRHAGLEELDARGRTVIPGLIDAHSHVSDPLVPLAALYFGVTTLRDMGSSIAAGAMVRDAERAGVTPGARVVLSGFLFYPSPTSGGLTGDMEWMPRDSATMQRGLALLQGFGAGHVKMRFPLTFASGAMLVRLARSRGFSISGHCANPLPLVIAGISGQEHLDGQCDDRAAGMGYEDRFELYRAMGMWGIPTIYLHDAHTKAVRDTSQAHESEIEPFLTPELRLRMLSDAPVSRPAYFRTMQGKEARVGTERFHRARLPLALGTDDAAFPDGVHRELEELVRAGLSPAEALSAATLGGARVLGVDGQVGVVAVGKIADLVLLDADPLSDIRNTRRIFRIIQGGRVINRMMLRETAVGSRYPVRSSPRATGTGGRPDLVTQSADSSSSAGRSSDRARTRQRSRTADWRRATTGQSDPR